MDHQPDIILTEEEGTMQDVEDSIDCQDQLEQGGQFFDALCLEYQGKEVLSGKDNQGVFEAILDNLTYQGAPVEENRGRKRTIRRSDENLGDTFAESRREC